MLPRKPHMLGNSSSCLALAPLLSSSATVPGAAAVSPSLSLALCLQGGQVLLYHLFSRQEIQEWLSQSDRGLVEKPGISLKSKCSLVFFSYCDFNNCLSQYICKTKSMSQYTTTRDHAGSFLLQMHSPRDKSLLMSSKY